MLFGELSHQTTVLLLDKGSGNAKRRKISTEEDIKDSIDFAVCMD